MKSILALSLGLWMILLSSITRADNLQTTLIRLPDTILQQGEKSPYYGVLVAPDSYREYTSDRLQNMEIRKELELNEQLPAPEPIMVGESIMSNIGWFGLGVVTALSVCLILHK